MSASWKRRPRVDVETLMQALQVLKMARLEAMGSHRRRGPGGVWVGPATSGAWATDRDNAIRRALKEMRRGGVDLDRAPKEAVAMVIDANTPVEDFREVRPPRGGTAAARA
jgi:hypothetical protein